MARCGCRFRSRIGKPRSAGLRLGLYLPEQGVQPDDPTVWIQLDAAEPRSQVLTTGLNVVVVLCSVRQSTVTICPAVRSTLVVSG